MQSNDIQTTKEKLGGAVVAALGLSQTNHLPLLISIDVCLGREGAKERGGGKKEGVHISAHQGRKKESRSV